jgi:hypothetical protein
LAQIAGIGSTLAGTGLGQSLFGSPATGNQPATQGLLGVTANAAGNWLGKTYDSLVGKGGGTTPVGSYPLNDGGTLYANSDGSQSVMYADGRVVNYDRNGNQTSSGTVDAGGGGVSEADLYAQEQAARQEYEQKMLDEYQNYYNYRPYEFNYEPPPPDYSAPNFEE